MYLVGYGDDKISTDVYEALKALLCNYAFVIIP